MMVLSFLHTPAHTHTYTHTPVLVEQSQLTSLSMSYRDKFLSFFFTCLLFRLFLGRDILAVVPCKQLRS